MSPRHRRPCVVFVSGTGTAVGKTWWTAATARELAARGLRVAARKPAQSFSAGEGPTDAEILAGATGEEAGTVCPPHRWYARPMAPPWAAAALGSAPFGNADLASELAWAPGTDVVMVEGAGGPRSPLSDDGDNVDYARVLAPGAVVVVAGAGLGAVNAVRVTVAAFAGALAPEARLIVALNHSDGEPLAEPNRQWLAERDSLELVTRPTALAAIVEALARSRPPFGETGERAR